MVCFNSVTLLHEVALAYYLLRSAVNPENFFNWIGIYMGLVYTLTFTIPAIVSIVCSHYLSAVVNFINFNENKSVINDCVHSIFSSKISPHILSNMRGSHITEAMSRPHRCRCCLSSLNYVRLKYRVDFLILIYH